MMPFALIESASSRRRPSSTLTRGWNSFGARRSMSASTGEDRGGSGKSGMSALRPLPSAGRFSMVITWNAKRAKAAEQGNSLRASRASRSFVVSCGRDCRTLEHFAREREVRFGAARLSVVQNHRHPVARRFAETDVARDDRAKHFLLEELPHVGGNLLPQVRPLVEHRQQHA